MEPHESIPYNENIANAFYYAGYIETWGRGIQKICNACTDLGAAKPRYELLGTGLRVHFAALKSALFDENETQEQGGNRLGENYGETSQKSIVENIVENLSETQVKIVQLMRQKPSISAKEIAKELSIASRNVQIHIKKMQIQGIVSRVGPDKGGHWGIVEENPKVQDENSSDRLGEKLGENSDDWLGEKLGENRMTIISCLIQNPSISTRRLAELLDISTTAMEKNIKWLKDNRIIRHVGPAKGGRWEVMGKSN